MSSSLVSLPYFVASACGSGPFLPSVLSTVCSSKLLQVQRVVFLSGRSDLFSYKKPLLGRVIANLFFFPFIILVLLSVPLIVLIRSDSLLPSMFRRAHPTPRRPTETRLHPSAQPQVGSAVSNLHALRTVTFMDRRSTCDFRASIASIKIIVPPAASHCSLYAGVLYIKWMNKRLNASRLGFE